MTPIDDASNHAVLERGLVKVHFQWFIKGESVRVTRRGSDGIEPWQVWMTKPEGRKKWADLINDGFVVKIIFFIEELVS